MTTRTARCACGRVEVTVEGEPLMVYVCHCEFCQRRSGNVFIASAQFAEEQVISITGETGRYNGLEVDGVGAVANARVRRKYERTLAALSAEGNHVAAPLIDAYERLG